jgi:hypothetical protein
MIDITKLQELAECWPVGSTDRAAVDEALNFIRNAQARHEELQNELAGSSANEELLMARLKKLEKPKKARAKKKV